MSYTQWDKGFFEGYKAGKLAAIEEVRSGLIDLKDSKKAKVPNSYFMVLNELKRRINEQL